MGCVSRFRRFTIHIDSRVLKIDEPEFSDSLAGIKGRFDAAIARRRRPCYFDGEKDVGGGGVSGHVEIIPPAHDRDIWLWRVKTAEKSRILGSYDSPPFYEQTIEDVREHTHPACVFGPRRFHDEDLPVHELNSITFGEDARISHSKILVH